MLEAALDLGYTPTDDSNGATMKGAGFNSVTINPDGTRSGTLRTRCLCPSRREAPARRPTAAFCPRCRWSIGRRVGLSSRP